jgi:hypothetical protein
VFSSGAHHGPHAQLIVQAQALFGRKVGLLRGAGTRMAIFFYNMMRCLRMQSALEATIYSPAFLTLNPNERIAYAVADVKNGAAWKALYTVTKTVYPVIRILRYCDSTVPCMDKLYVLTCRAA